MKTPEEWMKDLIHRTGLLDLHLDDIAAIQSDARLSALEEAAKVCDHRSKRCDDKCEEIETGPRDASSHAAARHWEGMSEGAEWCARDLRSLASPAKKDTP